MLRNPSIPLPCMRIPRVGCSCRRIPLSREFACESHYLRTFRANPVHLTKCSGIPVFRFLARESRTLGVLAVEAHFLECIRANPTIYGRSACVIDPRQGQGAAGGTDFDNHKDNDIDNSFTLTVVILLNGEGSEVQMIGATNPHVYVNVGDAVLFTAGMWHQVVVGPQAYKLVLHLNHPLRYVHLLLHLQHSPTLASWVLPFCSQAH